MNDAITLIEKNIQLLEKGITLQEYVEKEELFLIDGDTSIYNNYGLFVICNESQKVYLIDGGNRLSAFPMSTSIHQFFISDDGCGNSYMHQHYANHDEMILKFYSYNPSKFDSMEKFESFLTEKYDEKYENYYDYVLRMNGEPIAKGQRSPGYNRYYNGAKAKPSNTLAAKLLRLKHNHLFVYNMLNAIVDILIKPIPLFIWILFTNNDMSTGENAIQNSIIAVMSVIGAYLAAVMFYLIFLAIVQIFKLFFCKYKKLIIRIRIFDIIIKLGSKKLSTKKERYLYSEHEINVCARKNKISEGQAIAEEHHYEKKRQDLEYAQKELERSQQNYDYNVHNAKQKYKSAKEGDGLFQSAECKRSEAREYAKKAIYDEQDIQRNQQEIERLERQLRNRK